MSIINRLNKLCRIDASEPASEEKEINELKKFSSIKIPNEYLEVIREKTSIEISLPEDKYIRIWSAAKCMEMNEVYYLQKYIPKSLAIGDDEEGNALLYAEGDQGFGLYAVAFDDPDIDEMIFIANSLEDVLVFGQGIEKLVEIC